MANCTYATPQPTVVVTAPPPLPHPPGPTPSHHQTFQVCLHNEDETSLVKHHQRARCGSRRGRGWFPQRPLSFTVFCAARSLLRSREPVSSVRVLGHSPQTNTTYINKHLTASLCHSGRAGTLLNSLWCISSTSCEFSLSKDWLVAPTSALPPRPSSASKESILKFCVRFN